MKKILFSLMAIALVVGLVGAGAFAYFSDTETSSDNTFTAGTLNVSLYDGEGNLAASPVWTFDNMKPGDVIQPAFIVENAGSLTVKRIQQVLTIVGDTELDDYLLVRGFWVGVTDTKADALYVIADPVNHMPGIDTGFNPYGYDRSIRALAASSQTVFEWTGSSLPGFDITGDGNVPGTVLPSGKFLVFIYEMDFYETETDQNDAQGDVVNLTMALTAEQE